jgi:hypothetical protein
MGFIFGSGVIIWFFTWVNGIYSEREHDAAEVHKEQQARVNKST